MAKMEDRQQHWRHIGALDGFRAMAAVMVVLFHYQTDVFRSGALGVDLFFVLSGFLITGLLLDERRRLGRIDLPRFYARRVIRLYPALMFVTLCTVVAESANGASRGTTLGYAGQAMTYTTNLFVGFGAKTGPLNMTWSLGVEEQFYLVWPPILVLLLVHFSAIRIAVVAFAAALAAHLLTTLLLSDSAGFYLPTSRFDQTLAGGLLAAALTRPHLRSLISRVCSARAAWVSILVLIGATFRVVSVGLDAFGMSLVTSLTAVIVIGHFCTHSHDLLADLFGNAPARWLGQRSYSLYLIHLPVLAEWSKRVDLHPAVNLPLVIGVAILAAHLLYTYIERPFLRFKPYARSGSQRPSGEPPLHPLI